MARKQNFYVQKEPWLSGSLRRKLTLFMVILCLTLVAMFWSFSVYLLQPAYHRIIQAELSGALDTVTQILDRAQSQGVPLFAVHTSANGLRQVRLSAECTALLQQAVDEGRLKLDGRCLDIADSNNQSVFLLDNIAPRCVLHPSKESGITEQADVLAYQLQPNGELITQVRRWVQQDGEYYGTGIQDSGQMVMGATVANGQLTVTVSANMERIPQAVNVLKRLLLPISCMLILISMLGAWMFSRWFTRPLSKLSAATKEMARGNYDVQVEDGGEDEIADLAKDFNSMAREVKRSTELQKDLIANISHDLRTPLTLIKGYAETVRDLTGDDPVKREEQLNVIVDETDRLSALVNSVMEYSRMSSGNEKPEPVQFDLYQLADEVSFRYKALCRQKGYSFDFAGDENCEILADPAQLERALHNLLGNAMNHVGEDGYIGLHLRKTTQDTVRVEVIDHGPGIAPDDLPHLFDKYYRSRSDEGKPGTGLGLSITKAVFETHGYEYGVNSRLGDGTTFWFEAPLLKNI